MTLKDEFEKLITKDECVYIFGTSSVARRIYELYCQYDKGENVLGFIVTNKDSEFFCGKNVMSLSECQSHGNNILVSVSKVYHPDIFEVLDKYGFKRIIECHKFYNLAINCDQNARIDDLGSNEEGKSVLSHKEENTRKEVLHFLSQYHQAFGGNNLYQSFERLNLDGDRPTVYRIEQYGLKDYLLPNSRVLDIGCNTGFLDLTLSDVCAEITGIEYNDTLVEIAKRVASGLGIENVKFECNDFNAWAKGNKEKFNIVFSFAVHIWLNVEPDDYAQIINNMLLPNGYLIFESQDIAHDRKYKNFCNAFLAKGLSCIKEGAIKDDGITNRKYRVFQKTL